MPASDPLPPKLPPTKLERRAYAAGLCVALSLPFCVALFNIIVNPLGEFGSLRSYRFNNVTLRETYIEAWYSGGISFYRALVEGTGADTFLIGSSRTLLGFDTCPYPHMIRLASPGLGIAGSSRMVDLILEGRTTPATLAIEVTVQGQHNPPASSGIIFDKLHAALSTKATYLSVHTVEASLRRGASYKDGDRSDCRATPYTRPEAHLDPMAPPSRQDFDTFDRLRNVYLQSLGNLLDQAEAICHRDQLRHRLRFFSLPLIPQLERFPELAAVLEQNRADTQRALDAPRLYKGSCDTSYVDYGVALPPGQEPFWNDPRLWLNQYHFSPTLGALGLKSILQSTP